MTAPGDTCEGSQKAIGGWVGGSGDTQTSEINNIYEVQRNTAGTSQVIGWVYATFSAGSWFQPNLVISVSGGAAVANIGASASTPSVSIGSTGPTSIQGAMSAFDSAVGIVASGLPSPWQSILRGTQASVSACYTYPWNGSYSS